MAVEGACGVCKHWEPVIVAVRGGRNMRVRVCFNPNSVMQDVATGALESCGYFQPKQIQIRWEDAPSVVIPEPEAKFDLMNEPNVPPLDLIWPDWPHGEVPESGFGNPRDEKGT